MMKSDFAAPDRSQPNLPRQRWVRIIPVVLVMYTICFIDRTNISMALPSISHTFGMTPTQAGDVAGVFFWGYLLLQLPGGHWASHWSAKRVVSILLVLWGLCAIGCALTTTWRQLWVMRLLLGVAEGGVWPSALILLANWFPRRERARANAYFMLCLPLSVIISSPLSGWILTRWNWRVMLAAEGVLPLIWLIVWILQIDDHPGTAKWLSNEEREPIETLLEEERVEFKDLKREPYIISLFRPQVLLMVMIYFLFAAGCSGYLFWLPTVLGSVDHLSHMVVGILMILPFVLTGIMMVANSTHSDASGERRGHVSVAVASAGIFLVLAVWMRHSQLLAYVLVCLAAGGPYAALGPFWAIASETLPPRSLGSAMGMITGLGNLGGYFGPLWVGKLRQGSGNFAEGFYLMGLFFLIAAGLAIFLKRTHGAGRNNGSIDRMRLKTRSAVRLGSFLGLCLQIRRCHSSPIVVDRACEAGPAVTIVV